MSLLTSSLLLALLAMVPFIKVFLSYLDSLAVVHAGVCTRISLENPACSSTFAACHVAGGVCATWGDKLGLTSPMIAMCRTVWDACPGLAASAVGLPG